MTQRTIKFRAWDKAEKQMLYEPNSLRNFFINFNGEVGEHNENGDVTYNDGVQAHSDEVVLMQFTGLHDKNGKEIWEGDIVRYEGFIDGTGEVKFGTEELFWGFSQDGEYNVNHTMTGFYVNDERLTEDCEVIGNIYENPELMKQ